MNFIRIMRTKLLIGFLFVLLEVIGIVIVLGGEKTLVVHPKGIIANEELQLIIMNILLMLIIILPTYLLLFWVVWRYCIKSQNAEHDPDQNFGVAGQVLMWVLPAIIVAVMALYNWNATHKLDPYKPIVSDVKPLMVQVVALNWKWLFIYPELGIATLNYLHIPEKTPIHLKLTADHSPMNSFWIPQLSGQIYSMTGMSTQLYLMADAVGKYKGRAVEINGEGYADMSFSVQSSSKKDFDAWAADVGKASLKLTDEAYRDLVKPEVNKSVILYSDVEIDLFSKIIHQYMYPTKSIL
jgi:cytochrome o ubiquinol oxidase subunit 2